MAMIAACSAHMAIINAHQCKKMNRTNVRYIIPGAILTIALLLCSYQVKLLPPEHVKNFHYVDNDLHRCGQPQGKGMKELEQYGIKTIVNLRNVIDDKQEIKGTSLVQVRVPMRAKKISYQDIVDALCAFEKAKKPVVVHCLHGSDRTGCVVAAYRMTHGWSKEDAITELKEERFGYNSGIFPNIEELLLSIDPQKLKKDVHCTN